MNENELYHHGVIGMKWGVRRYQNKDGSLTAAGKKRQGKSQSPNKTIKNQRKSDLKKRRTMSDADLKKKIERLKLEKQFKDLTEDDISPGKKAVKNILSSVGTKVLVSAAVGSVAYAGKAYMSKNFDVKEAANYIFPNPNKKK